MENYILHKCDKICMDHLIVLILIQCSIFFVLSTDIGLDLGVIITETGAACLQILLNFFLII